MIFTGDSHQNSGVAITNVCLFILCVVRTAYGICGSSYPPPLTLPVNSLYVYPTAASRLIDACRCWWRLVNGALLSGRSWRIAAVQVPSGACRFWLRWVSDTPNRHAIHGVFDKRACGGWWQLGLVDPLCLTLRLRDNH